MQIKQQHICTKIVFKAPLKALKEHCGRANPSHVKQNYNRINELTVYTQSAERARHEHERARSRARARVMKKKRRKVSV